MSQQRYAIIDIETTGMGAARERITEIAIVLHDGTQILETFDTLINPERSVSPFITQLTGINDTMLADAPKFYEVAKKIVQMTEGAIFVAHNVRFDYSFVQEEFRRLGFTYTRKQLDTVRLARNAYPGLRSYSLGNLIQHFKIKTTDRHRALADALATAEIFEKIMNRESNIADAKQMINKGIKENSLPNGLTFDRLHALPETCGVYYLHDDVGEVVYVGKSLNIQKRIFEHFGDKTPKGDKLQKDVFDISFEETGSELVALLLEDIEIKRIKPKINKAQRRTYFPYGIYAYKDEKGYLRFQAVKNVAEVRKKHKILQEFSKLLDAKNYLKGLAKRFELCEKMMQPQNTEGACFYYHVGQCRGACVGSESADDYNERAESVAERLNSAFEFDFLVLEKGKTDAEMAVVLVENGQFSGFGYLDTEGGITTEDCLEAVRKMKPTVDSNHIIRQFLQGSKKVKVIKI